MGDTLYDGRAGIGVDDGAGVGASAGDAACVGAGAGSTHSHTTGKWILYLQVTSGCYDAASSANKLRT